MINLFFFFSCSISAQPNGDVQALLKGGIMVPSLMYKDVFVAEEYETWKRKAQQILRFYKDNG